MQQRLFGILLSFVTSFILLGHTFVPHLHEEQHSGKHTQHHHEHGGLNDHFNHHCHSTDCFTSIEKQETKQTIQQQVFSATISQLPFINATGYFRPVVHKYNCGYVYTSPHLIHLDFRGPPAICITHSA